MVNRHTFNQEPRLDEPNFTKSIPIRIEDDDYVAMTPDATCRYRNKIIIPIELERQIVLVLNSGQLDYHSDSNTKDVVDQIYSYLHMNGDEFGVIGIQVAGQKLHLYVLIRDDYEINRLFLLRSVDIPTQYSDADQTQVQVARLQREIKASEDENALSLMAYNNERQARHNLKECQDHGKALDFKLSPIEKAKDKQLLRKHLTEWEYKTLEAKGLTIKVTMPNSPDVSSSFYSDSSDTGSLTGGMHQKFDTIHRHGRRTSDILGNNEEELHSSDNEDSENSSNSIIIEGMSNTDIPPLFNDSNSSSSDDSDDSEIRSLFSSDNDIHASCRQIHIQNIRLQHKVEQELRKYHNERGLLEFDRDHLVNDLEIAEDDINNQNQIINNLNQEILLLQNNIHINNNRTGMAGYPLPKFNGLPGDLCRWCECGNIHPNGGHNIRIRIEGIIENCFGDDAKDWYESNIKGKNWESQHITANIGVADLHAINALTNNGIRAINANRFRDTPNDANLPAVPVVPAHTVWDEDWLTSGGRPTDLPPNAPNAGNDANIVASGIRIGQMIDRFKHEHPTITAEKSQVMFHSLTQGNEPVNRYYSKLKRLIKQAYPALADANQDELLRQQLFKGITNENKMEVSRIEIKRRRAELMLGEYNIDFHLVTAQSQTKIDTGVSKTELKNLIKSMIPSSEPQQIQIRPKNHFLQWIYGEIPEFIPVPTPPLPPKPQIKKNGNSSKNAEAGSDDELANCMSRLSINNAISEGIQAGVHAVVKKSSHHRCSNCNKTGHNSCNCP
ncbi:4509_t:CDS:2, partial [Entrophospora sp. SA101]